MQEGAEDKGWKDKEDEGWRMIWKKKNKRSLN